jgi:sugar phosphate isomerase/epimerase
MYLTMLLPSLPLAFEEAVRQAADLGFTHVDVVGMEERPASHREVLADSGLLVSCAAVGRDEGGIFALDAAEAATRRSFVATTKRQIADAAQLGATYCYLVPGTDASTDALLRFGETCSLLADYAAKQKVLLCVEHLPGRALPSVAATLAWLKQLGHANLSLLLDIGHCLISGEEAAAMVREAGERLGYVHCDDNDGVDDRHWPLLKGRLTEENLRALGQALGEVGYRGLLCLELNAANADPVEALRQGKALLERLVLTSC